MNITLNHVELYSMKRKLLINIYKRKKVKASDCETN